MIINGQAENVKTLLDSIEAPRDLGKEIQQNKGKSSEKDKGKEGDKAEYKTYEEYEKDPKALLELQNTDNEKYEEIVNAYLDASFED